MKKIGDTIMGDILVEMSRDEWEYLQRKPEATIIEMKWDNLETWQAEFVEGFKKLDIDILGIKVHNAIIRAAWIRNTDYEKNDDGEYVEKEVEPHLWSKWTFESKDKILLGFDQWCDYVLENPDNFYAPNIGKVGLSRLVRAIAEYKKNVSQSL